MGSRRIGARDSRVRRPVSVTSLSFFPLTDGETEEVLSWHYEAPYDFYDPASDPEDAARLRDPAFRRCHMWAARDADGHLVGFVELTRGDDAVEVGLGLAPGLTGRGFGVPFVKACLDFARRMDSLALRLHVAAFNVRAIEVYARCGFVETGREVRHLLGRDYPFIRMDLTET